MLLISCYIPIIIISNQTYGSLFDALTPFIRQLTRIDRTFRIAGVVGAPKGKWPESFGSVTALEEEVMFQVSCCGM